MCGSLIIVITFYLTVQYVAFLPLPVLVQKREKSIIGARVSALPALSVPLKETRRRNI